MRRYNNETRLMITLLILIGLFGIGYAMLGANLKINGVSEIPSTNWSVQFKTDSINVTEGSVPIEENTNQKEATIDSANQVSYKVKLSLPGDFYEFTVVVENTGSIGAMIDSISSKLGDTEIVSGTLPSYLNYFITYSDGTSILPKQTLEANTEETIKVRLEFKKDITINDLPSQAETLSLNFQINYVQKDLTAIDVPHSFSIDSWETIINNVHNNTIPSYYTVGSEKEVDMGVFGTHTLRIANTSTPEECGSSNFSETACGFVLEFADILTKRVFHSSDTNSGGWPITTMRTYVNNDIFNSLPSIIKNNIIDTKVVSGHGNNSETNSVVTDKVYLFSTVEIWGVPWYDSVGTDLTRQLDYYKNLGVTNSNYADARKKYNDNYSEWWLRSANVGGYYTYDDVTTSGSAYYPHPNNSLGISPAFRLG